MTLKRAFWWGKVSGVLAGGVIGGFGLPLAVFLDAVLNGRIQSSLAWLWEMIFYGFVGLFCGVLYGAIAGVLIGVLIAWTQLDDLAPTVWSFTWAVMALLLALFENELRLLLLPAVGVWLGGVIGWRCGELFLSKVKVARRETAVPTPVEPA